MAKKYEELTFTDDFMFCKILEAGVYDVIGTV